MICACNSGLLLLDCVTLTFVIWLVIMLPDDFRPCNCIRPASKSLLNFAPRQLSFLGGL